MKTKQSTFTRWSARAGLLTLAIGMTGCATMAQPQTSNQAMPIGATADTDFLQTAPEPKPAVAKHDPFMLAKRADTAYDAGRLLEAQRYYRALSMAVPDDGYSFFRMGNIALRQGEIDRAEDAYTKALERDNANPKAWYNLATARLMSAQMALRGAHERLPPEDPAWRMTQDRLVALDSLIAKRLQETESPAINDKRSLFLPVQSASKTRLRK